MGKNSRLVYFGFSRDRLMRNVSNRLSVLLAALTTPDVCRTPVCFVLSGVYGSYRLVSDLYRLVACD